MKLNKNKGITLVALVITIIILLILAGISISALTQTGIFGKAKQAEQKSKDAQEKENTTLGTYENEINEYLGENPGVEQNKPSGEKLVANNIGKVLSTTENIELEDINRNKIVVPAGFKIISDSTTENATTVDKGIVIEDATETATKGSQFVWIPVGTITKSDGTKTTITLGRYDFAEDGKATAYSGSFVEEDTNDSSTLKNIEGKSIAKNITNFKNSVAANKGYYIGRYEARTGTRRIESGSFLTQITEKGTDQVYNYVTQQQAAQQAQGMYTSNIFTSDLMNSYAWDTATLFLQSCGTNTKYSRQTSLNKSFLQTGTANDKQCNVYDMASNMIEWTTETSNDSSNPCVSMGGYCNSDSNCTCFHAIFNTSDSYVGIGFRPILYL